MDYTFTALLKKTISFRRLTAKNVLSYEVYATYKDDKYSSGMRQELLDTIKNPIVPNPVIKRITLNYNDNATWQLPYDAYLDRDHQFRLYLNGFILGTMEMEYYQDIITKDYMLEQDCQISIKPIFKDSYTYGYHNIII